MKIVTYNSNMYMTLLLVTAHYEQPHENHRSHPCMACKSGPSDWLAQPTDEELAEYVGDDDVEVSPSLCEGVGVSPKLQDAVDVLPLLLDGVGVSPLFLAGVDVSLLLRAGMQ
jgi:hypothetical protein